MAKIKEGVCGLCGSAQIKPTLEEISVKIAQNPNFNQEWISGHLYDFERNLLKVRCFKHAEEFDPRRVNLTYF